MEPRLKGWAGGHAAKWYKYLTTQGYSDADALRLSTFFGAQDAFETADGTNRGARELNNFGGMMNRNGYIKYNTVEDYMKDKLGMMKKRFPDALNAKTVDEYARILGDPARAGNSYLYYVTDKVPINYRDPNWMKNQRWIDAQTEHMHNYINGMRAKVGMRRATFAEPAEPVTIMPANAQGVIQTPSLNPSEFITYPELKDPKANRQILLSPATLMQTPVINISTDLEKLKHAGYTSMLPPMINVMSAIANDTDPYLLLQSRMNFPIL